MRLTNDPDLWYKYRVDYEQAKSRDGDFLTNLIKAFVSKGRKRYLPYSPEEIRNHPERYIRQVLTSAYVESLWNDYGSGIEYETSEVPRIATNREEGIISEVHGDCTIVWMLEPTIVVQGDYRKEVVFGRKLLEAESILLRPNSDGKLEIRASRRGRKLIQGILKGFQLERTETPFVETDLNESLESLFVSSAKQLRLIGVKFAESSLPDRSKLSIENNIGVEKDIVFLKEQKIIQSYSITDLKEMSFQIIETGREFKLKIKLLSIGYFIDIYDNILTTPEREEIKRILQQSGLPIKTVCIYKVEKNLKTIFHKLLSGSIRAYDEYFLKLPREIAEPTSFMVKPKNDRKWTCQTCGMQYEEEKEDCSDCGGDRFAKSNQTLSVDEKEILDFVRERLSDLPKQFETGDCAYSINSIKKLEDELMVSIEFMRSQSVNREIVAEPFTFLFPMYSGKIKISSSIDDYLQYCSLVTYGEAAENERILHQFGRIDLFDILCSTIDVRKELFHSAIRTSIQGIEDRIARLSVESFAKLEDAGKLDPKMFEKCLFYLLKRLFPLSERLAKIAKKEADGLIIFVNKSGECIISSYDAKHSETSYKLRSSEQNQAAVYILGEKADPRIYAYTKGKGIRSHIMISNNFDHSKIDSFLKGTGEVLRLAKDVETRVPLVVLQLKELLDIYSVYSGNIARIEGDEFVKNVFYDEIWKLFSSNENHKVVSREDVKEMKETVIRALSTSSYRP
ncbi:MAG: hypothetical protein ACYCQJ_10520 [Nitrososphaerales archaeon]